MIITEHLHRRVGLLKPASLWAKISVWQTQRKGRGEKTEMIYKSAINSNSVRWLKNGLCEHSGRALPYTSSSDRYSSSRPVFGGRLTASPRTAPGNVNMGLQKQRSVSLEFQFLLFFFSLTLVIAAAASDSQAITWIWHYPAFWHCEPGQQAYGTVQSKSFN